MIDNPFESYDVKIKAWALDLLAKEISKARLDAEIAALTITRDATYAGMTDQINKLVAEREAMGK